MTINRRITPAPSVFRPDGVIMLADVLARAGAELEGTAARDLRSAFAALETKIGIELAQVPATPEGVRSVFADLSHGELGVSAKRLANIRSCVTRAVERFGMHRQSVTRAVPLTPAWANLLESAEPKNYRWGLNRLAAFCSATGVEPNDVSPETLLGFHDQLEAECFVKSPRKILKHTIALWNCCMRRIEGWPQITLSSPFRVEPDMLPLDAFPESFRADVNRWTHRVTMPDPLDPEAPVKALRSATIKGYLLVFRRFASALVRRGVVPAEQITSLAMLVEKDHFKEAARHYLPRDPKKSTCYAFRMCLQLLNVARHYVKLPEERLKELANITSRLDPKTPRGMGKRHRDRLDQFDNAETVRRLLAFPEEEAARAKAMTSPLRRAKAMERALAIALLIHTGLRIKNLRRLRLDRHFRRSGTRMFLDLSEDETKNEVALTLELPGETVDLLETHLAQHRPHLPCSKTPWLFPGKDGGPRSDNAMRAAVSEPLRKHAGITINPHLYRHAIAKIVVERNPEMYVAISRRLGHKSINTTLGSYLGTETRAASRQINRLLDRTRLSPEIED